MALTEGGTRDQGLINPSFGIVAIEITFNSTQNGDTVEITFYEDVDNDGIYENSQTFTVGNGTTDVRPIQLDGDSGNEIYWEADVVDDGDVTTALSNLDVELTYS